jgi:hypothetical protein
MKQPVEIRDEEADALRQARGCKDTSHGLEGASATSTNAAPTGPLVSEALAAMVCRPDTPDDVERSVACGSNAATAPTS